jgi:Bacterial EndoU nuclease
MRLVIKVTPLKTGTSEPSGDAQLLECPSDVEPDTMLSFVSQRFGEVVDTAWTSTERHARLACGWIFATTAEDAGREFLCVPLVAMDDGSLRSMFELQADQRAEFEQLAHDGAVGNYTVVELPQRIYQPASVDRRSTQPPAGTVSAGGGHRHGTGRAGATEFPASWSDDQIIAHILSVARHPELPPVWQPNQRWRFRGARDGVEIVVLVERDGTVVTAWPLPGGRGVQQNPAWGRNADETQLAEAMKLLPSRFADRLETDDLEALRMMADVGEWAEEVNLLVATLAHEQRAVTDHERCDLTYLLGQFELAADQLELVPSAANQASRSPTPAS